MTGLKLADRCRVVVVGSANMDLTGRVERLPRAGETVLGHGFAGNPGGKGANQAVAAARLGAEVVLVACVGDDRYGQELLRGLESDGVDTGCIRTASEIASGVALIGVDDMSGENFIMVFPGANDLLGESDIARARESIVRADILICSLEAPISAISAAVLIASQSGRRVVLNPAPARPLPADLLGRVFVATPNEHEARTLCGDHEATPSDAATALLALGVANVVVTLGPRGALVVQGARSPVTVAAHSPPGAVVDTTAAGDCFSAALAVGIAEGKSLLDAARFANAAAALSVTERGAQSSLPTRAEVDALIAAGTS